MAPSPTRSSYRVLAALVLLGACTDGPVSPGVRPEAGYLMTAYECTVDVPSGATRCQVRSGGGGAKGPMLDIIAGVPHMSLTTNGAVVSNGNPANPDTTTLNWVLHNNIPQSIGTSDGLTPHPNGTRLFFISGPSASAVSSGILKTAGVVAANALGPANFTSTSGLSWNNRRYYQYDGLIAPNDSASTLVVLVYASRVTQITYNVLVATPVLYEYGWLTLSSPADSVLAPGATTALTAAVYNEYGVVQSDGISWSTSDAAVATVDASGGVTAVGEGTATITATSTVKSQRTAMRTIVVDAAPTVTGTSPAENDTGVSTASDIVVTFSEAVDVTTSSFTLECPTGWFGTFTVSGSGTSTITLNPNSNLPASTLCDLTVVGGQVSDVDTNDGPNFMPGNYVTTFQTS